MRAIPLAALTLALAVVPVTAWAEETPPPPTIAPLPTATPVTWPVQDIRGTVQDMTFVTSTVEGDSVDAGDEFVLLADVMFAYNRHKLTARAKTLLDEVAARLTERSVTALSVVGHTDSDGSDAANLALSRRRAKAVKSYLTGRLDPSVSIRTVGKGESDPRADNQTKRGRALNRRVEITVG